MYIYLLVQFKNKLLPSRALIYLVLRIAYCVLVAPCFKNLLRLEAGYPALRCHNLTKHRSGGDTHPSDLKIPPGFGLVGNIIRDRNKFSAREKASNQQAASERRAVKEDELPAELEQQGQRDEARRRLGHLQQVADQRRAELQQRFADRAVHLARC